MTQPGGPPAAVMDALRRELTEQELDSSVVYVTADQLPASTHLELPRLSLDVPWDAYLAFVDRQPLANWSHSARYVLFNLKTGESRSYEAKFPPFGPESRERWLLAHKAASLPDSAVHTPG